MSDERRSEVIRVLVEEHILTGAPVSSAVILERSNLTVSSATIRGDLVALERDGLAVQPHTSAGRIPTAAAYRYYVDHLAPRPLGKETLGRISGFFDSVQVELAKLLKETTELLSDVTSMPSVVVAPGFSGEEVKALHLVQLAEDQILTMVVTEAGRVIQQRTHLEDPITPAELEEAERLIVPQLVGSRLGRTLELPEERLGSAPVPTQLAVRSALSVVDEVASAESEIYLGGTRQMAALWDNLDTVQRVLDVLEREAVILDLVAPEEGTSIRIGEELPLEDVDMAVVSAGYESGRTSGTLGVIGPMRMDYRSVISAVEEISRELGGRITS
ncbi:MAG: heat-inducible transcription repressor HrcA [Acidimicrobiia bacterium]|nr:heat-inducible transcription repressor HrcA [Acidimicrobiia bacterium]